MNQAEVTVGVEDGEGGLATCGWVVQRCTAVAWSHQRRWGGGRGMAKERRAT